MGAFLAQVDIGGNMLSTCLSKFEQVSHLHTQVPNMLEQVDDLFEQV